MRYLVAVVMLLVAMSSSQASAESTFDLYYGQVSTEQGTFTYTDSGGFSVSTTDNFSERPAFGMRATNWFTGNPNLGIAVDMSYFRPEGQVTSVDTLPLSLLFAIRAPAGPTFPTRGNGFVYFSAGPSLFFFDVHARLPFDDTFKGLGADVGLDARAGINWRVTDDMAFFVEYRHTRFEVDGTYVGFFGWGSETITMEIESDHINFGISF